MKKQRDRKEEPPQPFAGVQSFLFNAPLYERFACGETEPGAEKQLLEQRFRIDGHCPFCGRQSTFTPFIGTWTKDQMDKYWRSDPKYNFFGDLAIQCARDPHTIRFHLRIVNRVIQKTGQYPSFADIALDESKTYRAVLSKDDAAEFHKSIGLASHGVGIGSFVYIRRIFERLIEQRFNEFKAQEGWTDEDFKGRRTVERIELLASHLPPFLVQNSKLYGILSQGIHQLEEQECLSFFEVIRASTVIILEEDKKKKEDLALRTKLEKAIAAYTPKQNDAED
jgi:hypothetical protein